MELLFDSANLADLAELVPVYPVAGVTTNPTILKAEGRVDFYEHLRAIRAIIGPERGLHAQVVAPDPAGMVAEAHRLREHLGPDVYVKVPVTEPGLAALRQLADEGIGVTATAVYSKTQGILAVAAGARYVAVYVNRMEGLGIDPAATIASLARFIERDGAPCTILGASFKNVTQVHAALDAGAGAVTVAPSLFRDALSTAGVLNAVEAFAQDWRDTFGTTTLP